MKANLLATARLSGANPRLSGANPRTPMEHSDVCRDNRIPALLRGACCGMAATVPMTAVMLGIQYLLPKRSREPLEPRQITSRILDRFGDTANGSARRDIAAVAAHFGYGAMAGAGYAILDGPSNRLPARGAAYGLALYTVSYAGWLPLSGIMPTPPHRPRGRNVLLITSHLVWGAVLQSVYSKWKTPAS